MPPLLKASERQGLITHSLVYLYHFHRLLAINRLVLNNKAILGVPSALPKNRFGVKNNLDSFHQIGPMASCFEPTINPPNSFATGPRYASSQ